MHSFSSMHKKQYDFAKYFLKKKHEIDLENITEEEKETWTRNLLLCMIKESTELLNSFDWRLIGDQNRESKDELLENGIDVFKFLLEILIINGFSSEDIENKFFQKSKVVESKFEQELFFNSLKETDKIALIDIDGVLSDYPETFLSMYGKSYSTIEEFKREDLQEYTISKDLYRKEGHKNFLQTKEYAQPFLDLLRRRNIKIILLTSRPIKKYPRMYHDTLSWLDKNNLVFDSIIWESKKAEYAISKLKNKNIVLCIDDEIENVRKYAQCNFNSYLLFNPGLKIIKEDDKGSYITINNLKEVFNYVKII